ncbi:MAG: Asp23/Gls24 family envelope stress response protein [Candidatus Dormibacteria bacterium]
MNRILQQQDLGRIEVSSQVVASIAGHAANECYGVVAMAARGLRDGIAERLQRENLHRGVEVRVADDGIDIALYVVVEYGVRITEVAHSLQDAVKYQVEKALAINVRRVDVNIQGIHMSELMVQEARFGR